MSSPSSSTSPLIFAVGVSSCIRLRIRRNVDLPHPDGPINAVTVDCRHRQRHSFEDLVVAEPRREVDRGKCRRGSLHITFGHRVGNDHRERTGFCGAMSESSGGAALLPRRRTMTTPIEMTAATSSAPIATFTQVEVPEP